MTICIPNEDRQLKNMFNDRGDAVASVISFLCEGDEELYKLFFIDKVSQNVLARRYGLSQPSINYQASRIRDRIEHLLKRPLVNNLEFSLFLGSTLSLVDAEVVFGMWMQSNQSVVAERMNTTQGFVRYRFMRSVKKIKRCPEKDAELYSWALDWLIDGLFLMRKNRRSVDPPIVSHC